MKRRDFLKYSLPTAIGIPSLINGFQVNAMPNSPWSAISADINTDRVLVIIQKFGGNDGLNMVFPLDQYDKLANARGNILMPKSNILKLSDNANTGLHPALTGLLDLYNNAKLSIVQSVSYINPSFSHFRATDIWTTGSNSDTVLTTGWGGRYLEEAFTGFPTGYPNASMQDPLALQIGSQVSGLYLGSRGNTAFPIESSDSFYNLVNGISSATPNSPAGEELAYIRNVTQTTNIYTQRILAASANVTSQYSGYPPEYQNRLADQLKIVARMIAGGLKTRVYMVTMDGFDTHSNQVEAGNKTIGQHADLMAELSTAITAFMADLAFLNIDNRVLGLTFSEFGRRILSNDSLGTDHGVAAPMFIFGKNVKPGVVGLSPVIPTVTTEDDNVPMQFDFKQVYSAVLKNWFCANDATLSTVFGNGITPLEIINPSAISTCATVLSIINIQLKGEVMEDATNLLIWTANRVNEFSGFEIFRSKDLAKFEKIGQINTAKETEQSTFQFIDKEPFGGFSYYKIMSKNIDGTTSYSNVVSLKQDVEFVNIYPNPATDILNIDIAYKKSLNTQMNLINSIGQTIISQKATTGTNPDGKVQIDVSQLPYGVYILNIMVGNELKKSEKIIVKR